MPTCAFVSFRLGLDDGVSVVAAEWMRAVEDLGFDVVTVAGEGPVTHRVPGLELGASGAPDLRALERALAGTDLAVVENLLTIPMNLPASRAVAEVLRGRPALLHHHDPPWQRDRYRDVTELPAHDPCWRHVTINHRTRVEMEARGIEASVVYNGFDVDPPPGDRASTRAALGVGPDEVLLVQPVRAVARKAIPIGIGIAEAIGATYWLTGPAEEGYGPELEELIGAARCRVIHRPAADVNDLYAAADVVLFPSTWEGFGNPPVEASIRRRPVVVGRYPVLDELLALGFSWLDPNEVAAIDSAARAPDEDVLARNRELAVAHFSTDRMRARVRAVLHDAGWLP